MRPAQEQRAEQQRHEQERQNQEEQDQEEQHEVEADSPARQRPVRNRRQPMRYGAQPLQQRTPGNSPRERKRRQAAASRVATQRREL